MKEQSNTQHLIQPGIKNNKNNKRDCFQNIKQAIKNICCCRCFSDQLKIGKYTFVKDFTKQQAKQWFSDFVRRQLKKQQLQLYSIYQFIGQWQDFFCMVQRTQIQSMDLWNGQYQSIPEQIVIPIYSNLINLLLMDNTIDSIQLLCYLNSSKLQRIDLGYNRITNIKPLNKTKWNNLIYFYINNNTFNQIQLNRFKTYKQSLEFHPQQYKQNIIFSHDITYILKLQFRKLRFTRKQFYTRRIKQQPIRQCQKKIKKAIFHKYSTIVSKDIFQDEPQQSNSFIGQNDKQY